MRPTRRSLQLRLEEGAAIGHSPADEQRREARSGRESQYHNRARYNDKINGQSGNTIGWLNGYKMNIDILRRRSFLASLLTRSCCFPLKCQQVAQPEPGQPYIPNQSERPDPLAGHQPGLSSIFYDKKL